MPRIRTIKPQAFASDSLSRVSVHARWTFAGLWTFADDDGRGRADARLIRAHVWALDDDISAAMVTGYLDELERERCICRYRDEDGRELFHVLNWGHQKISHPTPSTLPECSREQHGGPTMTLVKAPESSVSPPVILQPEGKGREGNKEPATRAAVNISPESEGARANRLAKAFTDRVKLSNFPAVASVVRKAIKANYTDQAITDALTRMADEGRSVTTDALRIELEGRPPPGRGQSDVWMDAYNNDQQRTAQ